MPRRWNVKEKGLDLFCCSLPSLLKSNTVISLNSRLSLKTRSKLIISFSIGTTLSSCIFSAHLFITSFFPIRLDYVLT